MMYWAAYPTPMGSGLFMHCNGTGALVKATAHAHAFHMHKSISTGIKARHESQP